MRRLLGLPCCERSHRATWSALLLPSVDGGPYAKIAHPLTHLHMHTTMGTNIFHRTPCSSNRCSLYVNGCRKKEEEESSDPTLMHNQYKLYPVQGMGLTVAQTWINREECSFTAVCRYTPTYSNQMQKNISQKSVNHFCRPCGKNILPPASWTARLRTCI